MLEVIRTHRRWMLFFILILILPSFVFFGIQGYNEMIEGDRAYARVAGRSITEREVEDAKRRYFDELRRQYGPSLDPKVMDTPAARAGVMERLLSEKALLAEVARVNVSYSDAQLAEFYSTTADFLDNGVFSQEKKTEVANRLGLTGVGLDQLIRREQSSLLLRSGVNQTAIVPASVRDRLLALSEERREVRELRFRPEDFARDVKITDEDIKGYYDTNGKQFETPEAVTAEYVALTLEAVAAQVVLTEESVRKQYEATFGASAKKRAEVRTRAEALLAEVKKNPSGFAELAKKNSEDPGSAAQGGVLPAFGRGEMVKPFEDAAFRLRQGELASALVETEFGFHIVQLDDIQPPARDQGERRVARHILLNAPEAKRFEDVRGEIESSLRQQEAQRKFVEAAETFNNAVFDQSESLQPVAERLKLKVERASGVLRTGAPKAVANLLSQKVVDALFTAESLRTKNNTPAIEVTPTTLVAARVLEHTPAAQRPFDAVRAEIKKTLERERAVSLARAAADKRLGELRDKPTDTGFQPVRRVSRPAPEGLSLDALRAVMAVPTDKLPAYVIAPADGGSTSVFRVLSAQAGEVTDPARVTSANRGLAQQAGAADDAGYIATLKRIHQARLLRAEYQDAARTPAAGKADDTAR